MEILKRAGNFVVSLVKSTIELAWFIGTAAVVFTVWIVFCAGAYLWATLSNLLGVFVPNFWENAMDILDAIENVFEKKNDKEVEEKQEEL